jgi:chromosomal replication initiation ATPase DnaA
MWAPDDALLTALARKLFADRQLQVPDSVISRMLLKLERTPASVAGFVGELDRKSLAERRPVTERLVVALLDEKTADPE